MGFKDFIKKSVLDSEMFKQTFSWELIATIAIALFAALLAGLFIGYIYSRFFRGVVYSRTFTVTLVGMCVMTCMVTLAISTNIVISLGMVGALSIVRYRTAVKEPMDLLYLFWAITTGITMGAKMYTLAVLAALVMVFVLWLFNRRSVSGMVYILIVHYSGELAGEDVRRAMGNTKYRIKSKTLRDGNVELVLEIYAKNNMTTFADRMQEIDNVKDVTLVQYDGEYHV